ncbi:YidC/Oxa1 family membrane protein insertase [Patescibacteria group bacterium]|nr:YidC/Oxa1 family membrane protein insertase [Patescibacteria group bacterium]
MSFNAIFVYPIVNVLVAIYKGLSLVGVPYALGFSIIFITIFIKFILYPLVSSQVRATKKMQELAPHLKKNKEKYKKDAKRLQQETMKLYKEHGVNPVAGCLPVIIQIPLIWGLYSVFLLILNLKPSGVVSEINKIVYFDYLKLSKPWNTDFFGVPLGGNPAGLINEIGFLIILVPFATGFFQFILSKMMMVKPKRDDGKKKDDFASMFQAQALYIFPIMIGFFSFTFPIGLSLYWNTFTIFGIIQQYKIAGLGGLKEYINKINGSK